MKPIQYVSLEILQTDGPEVGRKYPGNGSEIIQRKTNTKMLVRRISSTVLYSPRIKCSWIINKEYCDYSLLPRDSTIHHLTLLLYTTTLCIRELVYGKDRATIRNTYV
jgi:hypothetical protein